jgi:dienelactone hydrolase
MSATAIAKEKIELAVGDGTRMEAYVARPEQGGPHVTEALAAQQKIYVNAEFSRADHGFFCDEPAAYEPHSARQAWALTLEFLRS